jgi:hypothetical protein
MGLHKWDLRFLGISEIKYGPLTLGPIFQHSLYLTPLSDRNTALIIDMDMPFGYLRISIPGPAHYGGGLEQGLED